MPITRKHFELGINKAVEDWMKKIYGFLEENKEAAYTREEIADSLEVNLKLAEARQAHGEEAEKARQTLSLFDVALTKLIAIDCVESREIRNTHYYAKGRHDLERVLAGEVLPFLR